jgi:hypothetical protein
MTLSGKTGALVFMADEIFLKLRKSRYMVQMTLAAKASWNTIGIKR